jgi:hypothetical protein
MQATSGRDFLRGFFIPEPGPFSFELPLHTRIVERFDSLKQYVKPWAVDEFYRRYAAADDSFDVAERTRRNTTLRSFLSIMSRYCVALNSIPHSMNTKLERRRNSKRACVCR